MDQAISLLREFGFPTFVCLWFMYRMEMKIDKFMDQQAKLILAITVLAQVLDIDLPPQIMLPRGRDQP